MTSSNAYLTLGCIMENARSTPSAFGTHRYSLTWVISISLQAFRYLGTVPGVTIIHCPQTSTTSFGIGPPVIPQTTLKRCANLRIIFDRSLLLR